MKKLQETIYILTPDSYVYHRNENICISIGGQEKASVPVSRVDAIVFFGKNSLSTSLIRFCGQHNITLSFLDSNGQFYGNAFGPVSGNVLLRKRQYESIGHSDFTVCLVRDILYGKICNSKNILMRYARNCKRKETAEHLYQGEVLLSETAKTLSECQNVDSLRGVEGAAATIYFARFDDMLASPNGFQFEVRSRRPPLNEVNAVLSFLYTQLVHDTRSALETVGLDPAAGYLHTLRPGRPSFALDLMEELRAPLCDRLTITLFNRGQLSNSDFQKDASAVYLNDKGRKKVLTAWRNRKQEEIKHSFLNEKIPIGLIPYVQAMLFARVLRGDLDRYPPFVWR
ncbi:MAG: type I-C CRISPR-associated endonuclease Cas1c [Butyricicoccus sp.]